MSKIVKELCYFGLKICPSYLLQRPAGPLPYLGPLFSFLTHGHLALAGDLPVALFRFRSSTGRQPLGQEDGRRQSITPAALPPSLTSNRVQSPSRHHPACVVDQRPAATAQPPPRRAQRAASLPGARSVCPAWQRPPQPVRPPLGARYARYQPASVRNLLHLNIAGLIVVYKYTDCV
jgi:hypothetical protein